MTRIALRDLFRSNTAVLCASLVVIGAACGRADVDLTPIPHEYELDGVKMSNVLFRDGSKELTYGPPQGWRISGSGKKLLLVPNTVASAEAEVRVSSLAGSTPVPIDEANAPKYVERALRAVPPDARKLVVLGTSLNPLRICGNDTVGVDLRYEAFGTAFRTYILFLNRKQDQWVFRFTAPDAGFDQPFEVFRSSLYSITGL